jgi:MYXO-CTERM domain-containing protein
MSAILVATVLSTMNFQGDVTADGGDYVLVPFTVPDGTAEIDVTHVAAADGEILDFGVWSPDGYRGWGGGLTDDAVIDVAQSSRGYLPGPLTSGTWQVVIGKALLVNGAGHYTITVTCSDTPTVEVQPQADYTPVVLSPARRWYKGDFHSHSIQSGDATATFDQMSALATQQGLDFINVSDHNTISQHALLAAYQSGFSNLLFLRGSEITTYGGHGNAVGNTTYVDHRIGLNGRTIQNVVDDVVGQGAIFIVNHPMLDIGTACLGCKWQHVDDTPWSEVSGIEVITGNFELGIIAFVPQVLTLWDSLIAQGFRIAAIGGSDDHHAGMNEGTAGAEIGDPTTNVLADNLSEAAIIDAVKHGRTVVQLRGPTGAFLDMTMKTKDGGSDAEIGDEVDGVDSIEISSHVTGGDGDTVQLFRNGVKVDQKKVSGDDTTVTFSRTPTGDLESYRLELLDATLVQVTVITSHIFVQGVVPQGCGCHTGGGAATSSALFGLALLAIRRKRR